MLNGFTKSCGCLKREANRTHGHTSRTGNTPTYDSWKAMKFRCLNPKARFYRLYGGRGIKICDRWLHSFENFLEDMGERPAGLTLDRRDSNGNYEPQNCRWATPAEQVRNTSRNIVTTEVARSIRARFALGERRADIARSLGLPWGTVGLIVAGRSWREVQQHDQ